MIDTGYTIPYGRNSYCGPAALAYVGRSDPDTITARLRALSGKRAIKGVTNTLLLKAVLALGLSFKYVGYQQVLPPRIRTRAKDCLTLRQWILLNCTEDGEYIVNITGHYVVIVRQTNVLTSFVMFDNRFRQGKHACFCPYLRRRVRTAWKIEGRTT
jgi:hypothetical protein